MSEGHNDSRAAAWVLKRNSHTEVMYLIIGLCVSVDSLE